MLTKEKFEKHIDSYVKINSEIVNFAESYVAKFDPGHLTDVEIDYDGATIVILTEYSPSCSCCGSDYDEHRIPMRYLWEGDWAEQEQAKRDEEIRKREQEKQRKEEELKKKQKGAEYEQFLRLKEKFQPIEIERLKLDDE